MFPITCEQYESGYSGKASSVSPAALALHTASSSVNALNDLVETISPN